MKEQNFKNHSRYLPFWHLIVPLLLFGLLGGSVNNLRITAPENRYSAALLILVAVIVIILYWYCRAFALRAQDKAIRAEENFRHFILTGQPLDKQLRMSQIIALRFASDAEFPALAKRAIAENLGMRDIKMAITNWKADHNRV